MLSFLRFGSDGSVMACVFNFSGAEHSRYRLGLPHAGTWREVLNTDATIYNGAGIGNFGGVEATDEPWHGRPASAVMVLPPTVGAVARTRPEVSTARWRACAGRR